MSECDHPVGASITLDELERDPHVMLARLRDAEPVSYVSALDGWLVTGYDLALSVMRDSRTFTVDDPRFSTARVLGPSMLSLDGSEHDRHRGPFARPFRRSEVRDRFTPVVRDEAEALIDAFAERGTADLRTEFAAPLAASVMIAALGLDGLDRAAVLEWYAAIVAGVNGASASMPIAPAAHTAFASLRAALVDVLERGDSASLLVSAAAEAGSVTQAEVISNAAVLLFGGIETTEGAIANLLLHVLKSPVEQELIVNDRGLIVNAVEESLRLEPAAAAIDRYATAECKLGGVTIGQGDLVIVSLAGANRDPAVFEGPDRFDVRRENARTHLSFAQGPHVCLGLHLARLEARTALDRALSRLPGVELVEAAASEPRGRIFRKPPTLTVSFDPERAR